MTKLEATQKLLAKRPGSLSGVISVPGDKSISHRAIVLSMITHKTIKIFNFLDSADTHKSLTAASKLGIKFFATGGIGGVHLKAGKTFDVSSDLNELSKTFSSPKFDKDWIAFIRSKRGYPSVLATSTNNGFI